MTDVVNDYFRRFYPPDWDAAWETDHLGGGSSGRRYRGSHKVSNIFPEMVCADGFTMSVQGHFGAHSWPRDDFADRYEMVEVMTDPDAEPLLGPLKCERTDGYSLYASVTIELVEAVIAKHGGLKP